MTIFHFARKLFLPAPLRMVYTLVRSVPYIFRGLRCVFRRKLEVEVLDALSIGVSMLRGDFATAGSVMFLLRLGELLEEWTRKKSLGDLARCMSLNVDRVWQQTAEGEVLVPISQVCAGDAIVVHTGSVIPLDGRVLDGEASVNQASLTGEAEPVRKSEGAVVYAGTVVEEGQITVTVEQQAGNGRYDQIVKMIENSEKLKSASETRAAALADKLVPYSLLGTAVTYALTRNATRAISILMVDFSCALKLSMPLAVLSAMRECGSYHITVKGGKYLEALANADTIVFDKTGTLTHATPTVVQVVPFGTRTEDEVLQIAACLEEHYPPTRWRTPSCRPLPQRASATTRCTARCSTSSPTALPARSAARRPLSAASTLSLRTRAAIFRRTSAANSTRCRRNIPTCIWPSAVCWPVSSALPTRCARKPPRF